MPGESEFQIGLSPVQLNIAFPFHLAVDPYLRVLQCGRSLRRICPDTAPGMDLTQLFVLKRPEVSIRFESLHTASSCVTLWEHRSSRMTFRGQIMPVEQPTSLLLLWSPWLSDNGELSRFGLSFDDFALHDPVVDLLQVLQSHKIAFQDLRTLTIKLTAQRTELKQANQELNRQFALLAEAKGLLQRKEAETRKLALIASHTDNAVILTDVSGGVEWVNEAFTRATGYSLDNMLGKRPGSLLQGSKTDPATVAYMRTQLEKQEGFTAELLNYKKTGEEYWIQIEVQPIRDEAGRVINYMAIQRDVTRHREYEQALVQAKQAADSASQAKSDFLAAMSHEIRSPMTAILGTLELLNSSPLDSDQRLWTRTAYDSAEALLKIIDDILDFSKIEAGKLELHHVSFDLESLLSDIVQLFRPRSTAKRLNLHLQFAEGIPRFLRGDPFRLRQILVNLIGNALKFTDQGGIEIIALPWTKVEAGKVGVRFQIKDTGIGIAKDAVGNLFQEFVQLESGNARQFGGTGLGLAICKRLVGLMGGEIGVESEVGVGSTFWFSALFVSDLAKTTSLVGSESGEGVALARGRGRILLAEDGEAIRLVISTLLSNNGYQVHAVSNGRDAVEALQQDDYDVVLMDGHMPIMDGSQATQAIRAFPDARARIPILALTANALVENRKACLSAGMDDFITKPVSKSRLLATISHWISRRESAFSHGDYSCSSEDGRLLLDAEVVQQLFENMGEASARQTLTIFFRDVEERVARIATAANAEDFSALEVEGHTLKASACMVGAMSFGRLAANLESASKERERQEALEIAHELAVLFEATQSAYREHGLL